MAIIVEDGSIVDGANSYVTVANVEEYATLMGVTFTGGEAAILNAMTFIESSNFKGSKYTSGQSLQWPRSGAIVFGWLVDTDTIPSQLFSATCEAAIKQQSGDILPDLERGGAIKREKVDVLEVEYFNGANANTVYQSVMALLKPLTQSSNRLVLA